MPKQLVFYVNKIMNRSGDIFIRILPNQEGESIWIPWNDGIHIPSSVFPKEKILDSIHKLLKSFSQHEDFKIIFNEEVFALGGNPYSKKGEKKKWFDKHLKLFPVDITYINDELFLTVIDHA